MERLLFLFAAGGVGTLARYAVSTWVQRAATTEFPWGILVANSIGSFAVGLLYTLAEEHNLLTGELRIAVLVGFLGAFTTFSTFAFDTSQLIRDDRYIWAASNMVLNNAIGLSLVFVGIWIGRLQGS
ncbi:MAG TPA: fluoride efflux transporter CrcB [Dehalococcoidia bacterium]|jgi:CrcB protein|nr:fluoride efflux transporter CrcB [Dehalococcoidia bacterium]MDP6272989.1 fluoride efflux transporter CrcB [Dehalococcoidia bacterium]MDP7159842.1 fluoride efflux transporter CrcB [Dehalococcoidia bacterium]MDP7213811.1 fluoride efflux transporter CrcB [Dehalococcoidia bacterium]MDP7514385.1 fluoride efflux transporter CrcB [Dehalococcoidia bacterium]